MQNPLKSSDAKGSNETICHSIVDLRPLDLVNFSRHGARIQFGGEC